MSMMRFDLISEQMKHLFIKFSRILTNVEETVFIRFKTGD